MRPYSSKDALETLCEIRPFNRTGSAIGQGVRATFWSAIGLTLYDAAYPLTETVGVKDFFYDVGTFASAMTATIATFRSLTEFNEAMLGKKFPHPKSNEAYMRKRWGRIEFTNRPLFLDKKMYEKIRPIERLDELEIGETAYTNQIRLKGLTATIDKNVIDVQHVDVIDQSGTYRLIPPLFFLESLKPKLRSLHVQSIVKRTTEEYRAQFIWPAIGTFTPPRRGRRVREPVKELGFGF